MDPIETTDVDAPVEGTTDTAAAAAPEALVEQELLVEDVSIDGMCGVY